MSEISIVEYYSKQKSNHCGYCSSKDGSLTYGLYAHTLKVEDYQNLIDRGWRRCGKYCYKSIMDCSCCPLYTIRCETKEFKLSKTQKKILKRFNNFLIHGTISKVKIAKNTELPQPLYTNFLATDFKKAEDNLLTVTQSATSSYVYTNDGQDLVEMRREVNSKLREPVKLESSNKDEPKKKEKNKSLKAKYLRIERKKQKLIKLGLSEAEIEKKLVEKKKYPVVKTIEDYLNEPFLKQQIHNLKITLVRSFPRSSEFDKTFSVSFDLYKRYQMFIHNDPPEKITQRQFEKFLVVSPLQALDGYGSYHQQYWLDNKLIAVGVIDILPKCLSSVYFFYDPDYAHLSLGTYGALREVEFTRKLSNSYPDLVYYYMGFYIHSCVKMKYKGAFKPSFLLCPEVYTWHPIKECLPKLDVSKYSRFNEDPLATDFNSKSSSLEILILYNRVPMLLVYYLKQKKCDEEELSEIMEYAQLVGNNCAQNMLLFRM